MAVNTDRDLRFITCVVPQGEGGAVLQALDAHGVRRASLGSARAPFTYTSRKGGIARTVHHSVEKDIITAVVPAAEADAVFALVHETARMADRPGGFMFMGRSAAASAFSLPPDLPQG